MTNKQTNKSELGGDEQSQVLIDDLFYELRMLLGAAKVCELAGKAEMGNLVNYFKDSAYLHSRNLYNFFSGDKKRYLNDAKIIQFITQHTFDISLYNKKWSDALHQHVLHIKPKRKSPNNVQSGTHLNTMIPGFACDIEKLWLEWISIAPDGNFKNQLSDALHTARKEAQDDYDNFFKKMKNINENNN